jgi:serine/threonine protein kinase
VPRSKPRENTKRLGAAGRAGSPLLDAGLIQKPTLGPYEVERELGKGAMGIVYLGRDPKSGRPLAIKTMALSEAFEEHELDKVKQRFFREAETAGRLHHPNIVTIYGAGEEHDLAYIAMEYVDGEDLTPHTANDSLLPLSQVLDIAARAAEALDYAHRKNVVHRDIKPANIMLEAGSGNVKLTDFGIARITNVRRTKAGMILGTPSYMSPEQLTGDGVDGRSDVFSLGTMLFQLVSGVLPFTGDSMAKLMQKIAHEQHPDVLALRPDAPSCLKAIIDKALAKAVEDRYQRAAAMARDLRRCGARIAA